MASKSTLLGAAGEHHVMAELLRRGYIATLAPAGVPNADIVVTHVEGGRLCSVQVKTRRDLGSDGGWHMKAKHEKIHNDRLFYCFVDFGKTPEDRPSVHVLPSPLVAKVLADDSILDKVRLIQRDRPRPRRSRRTPCCASGAGSAVG